MYYINNLYYDVVTLTTKTDFRFNNSELTFQGHYNYQTVSPSCNRCY